MKKLSAIFSEAADQHGGDPHGNAGEEQPIQADEDADRQVNLKAPAIIHEGKNTVVQKQVKGDPYDQSDAQTLVPLTGSFPKEDQRDRSGGQYRETKLDDRLIERLRKGMDKPKRVRHSAHSEHGEDEPKQGIGAAGQDPFANDALFSRRFPFRTVLSERRFV